MSGGNGHSTTLTFTRAPERAVSLVPSLTESLFDLGVGDSLVGITDFCRPPDSAAGRLTRIGGTRTVDVETVIALRPDVVLANQEENTRPVVEALEAAGLKVWVTFPRTVEDALGVLWALVRLFRIPPAGVTVATLEHSAAWTARAGRDDPVPTFVPIWQGDDPAAGRWWMTIAGDTYVHDVLRVCGADNIFADRRRRYPLAADLGIGAEEEAAGADTRYPRVTAAEVIERRPELILLPSEPFAFDDTDALRIAELLRGTPAADRGRVLTVDGSLLTWHGTRLGRALDELPPLIRQADPASPPPPGDESLDASGRAS